MFVVFIAFRAAQVLVGLCVIALAEFTGVQAYVFVGLATC